MDITAITTRFLDVLNEVMSREGLSKAEVARAIGLTPQKLSNISVKETNEDGKKASTNKVRAEALGTFCEVYTYVNPQYILTGSGSMFIQEQETKQEIKSNAQPLNTEMYMHVPLVNQYAYGGYLNGYQDNTYMDSLPTIPFIVDHEGKGNYIVFEVKGDSMNDGTEEGYLEGDRLLCREIPSHLWVDSKLHIKKWDFVIVHEDGIIVKRIVDHDVDNHTITVHSLNDFYPDRVIDLAEVRQIFNVVELQRPKRR